ncbi:MAG: electron transport complex subunit E [Treponema sp.]|nr:electron transport complex subunit E [Treponema sp.]MBQ2553216.1 electron transport complex subunit E [Treponema sp.]MBQ4235292.1 electron transport complex subunit E [Treponema sp.]MBQ5382916.1 electron transport complex subunit E [Treponema sp.]
MNKKMSIFTNGLIKENPLLILNIGLCSSLGITTSIFNGLGMGMGMTFVLVMSELVISIFRKHIPSAIRLPVFIVIIAAFTTIVQMVLQAFVTSLYDALGVFIPLIVVNCIIMGRVEAFASKNKISDSVLDALGMGIGYTAVLLCISFIREFFGGGTLMAGTALKVEIIPESYRIGVLNSAPGGFIVFGCLGALVQGIKLSIADKKMKAEQKRIVEKNPAKEADK